MHKITAIFCLLALSIMQSCAQGGGKKGNLPLRSIYEVTIADIQQELDTYGLKGPVKTVRQRQHAVPRDSVINLDEYEAADLRDDAHHALFAGAGMNNDCMLTFDETGRLLYRRAHGRRFSSNAVETDTLHYDTAGFLTGIENELVGDDFSFYTHTVFEYDGDGHLLRQSGNDQSVFEYTYDEANNQVKIVRHDDGSFAYDHVYTYDPFGLNIETHHYREDGSLEVRWEREYDDFGSIKKEVQHYPNGESHESKMPGTDQRVKVYAQYDTYGNCTKRLIMEPNGRLTIRERKFAYYK